MGKKKKQKKGNQLEKTESRPLPGGDGHASGKRKSEADRMPKTSGRKQILFIIIGLALILMLALVGYAQWQRGVVRTIGTFSLDEEDKKQPLS